MKNHFVKTVLSGLVLGSCLFANLANAGLLLNISDDGFGGTRWQLAGSTTAVASYNGNSLWAWQIPNMVNASSGCAGLTSGAGSMFSTTSGTQNVQDVCSIPDYNASIDLLSARVGYISLNIGDVVSWSGDFTTTVALSTLNTGVYTTRTLYNYSSDILSDDLTITIGSALGVPEPGMLALLGFSLAGIGFTRRKKA